VTVSVAETTELKPVPPETVKVLPLAIVSVVPVSPAKDNPVNEPLALTAESTYAVVATEVELLLADFVVAVAEAPSAIVPENVLLPVIV
jgi:hypothetical protein